MFAKSHYVNENEAVRLQFGVCVTLQFLSLNCDVFNVRTCLILFESEDLRGVRKFFFCFPKPDCNETETVE